MYTQDTLRPRLTVRFIVSQSHRAYLRKEWKSLAVLLGPTMLAAWFVSGLLIWGMIPGLTYVGKLNLCELVSAAYLEI
jgi:NhaP-type Na+/H+ or K+/H+ antiporter